MLRQLNHYGSQQIKDDVTAFWARYKFFLVISLRTYSFFFSMMGMTCRNQDRLVSYERNKNLDGTTAKASILFLTDCTMSESR